jgi:hypothetical protein
MARPSLRNACAALVLAACAATALPAHAQIGVPSARRMVFQPTFGVGYVANAPNQFAGVSAHYISNLFGGLGVYVDAKFDPESPRDQEGYVDSVTVEDVESRRNDQFFSEEGSWTSVNVALMRPLSPQFIVYLGAGYSDGKQYREYLDLERQEGREGFYWVQDEAESGGKVNVLGGAFFKVTDNVAFQLGGETAPGGITVGVSYLVPIR